jgi:integrase
MASRKQPTADLTGIRPRGSRFQVRVFGGTDSATGRQLVLTGSAKTEADAIALRDGFRKQIEQQTAVRTNVTLAVLLDEWLESHPVEGSTRLAYTTLIEKFIRPGLGDQTLPGFVKQGSRPYEKLYAELRVCRRRCRGRAFVEHRTPRAHRCDERCAPHACQPLSASSIRQCHAVLSSAYAAAVRWGWIAVNPMGTVQRPRTPTPNPDPPSPEDAARIVAAAWSEDVEWGLLVWLLLVTGARRGEILALRWQNLDLRTGVLSIRHSVDAQRGTPTIKDTKTHQSRRISLDAATVARLIEHRERVVERCTEIGAAFGEQLFVFSYRPDHTRPCNPSGVTHRYARMVGKLGIRTHLHAIRHYSATELLASGVDLRTVAGRLGHSSGGATTLRVYAAWVSRADQAASELLARRLPAPPTITRPADSQDLDQPGGPEIPTDDGSAGTV